MNCGPTHYAGCACHEKGWKNKWKCAIEAAAQAELKRDDAIKLAEKILSDFEGTLHCSDDCRCTNRRRVNLHRAALDDLKGGIK